jgi:hypothetical protein
VPHDHQPVDFGAIRRIELGQRRFGTPDDPHLGAENLAFDGVVGDLAVLRVEHGHRHRRILG